MAKNKGGRPTVMTPETLKKLEDAFLVGATDIQACLAADISHATLYNYQEKNPEFIDRKEALKSSLALQAKNNMANSIASGDTTDSKWYLERKEKAEFSTQTNTNSQFDGKLVIDVNKTLHSADNKS